MGSKMRKNSLRARTVVNWEPPGFDFLPDVISLHVAIYLLGYLQPHDAIDFTAGRF